MNDIKAKLDEPIPTDAIAHREAFKNGPQLSYLSGAYVINRLNAVLGHGNWGYEIASLTKVFEGTITQYSGEVFSTSYIAQVRLWYKMGDETQEKGYYSTKAFEDVGYGDGSDKKSPGKAHELAVKEAVTDGLKRAAKNLGMSFGLQLYFKEGQYVGEDSGQAQKATNIEQEIPKGASEGSIAQESGSEKARKLGASIRVRKTQIKNAFAILQDQKKITKEIFVADYTKGIKTDDLSDEQITEVLGKIKQNFPELGL